MILFFFGSLRDPDLLEVVLGEPPPAPPILAVLPDHTALRAAGYDFPVAVPRPGASLTGLAVAGLSAQALDRVRFFEDTEYELRPVIIETRAGPVEAHFFASAGLTASSDLWSLEDWQATRKPLMLAVTRELMAAHGTIPPGAVDALWHRLYNQLAPLFAPDEAPDAL